MVYYIGNSIDYPSEALESKITHIEIDRAITNLQRESVLGLDIETSRRYKKGTYYSKVYRGGLDPWLSRVVMIQIGTEEDVYVFDARVIDVEKLKPLLESDRLFVGANLKFECKHLRHNYGINLKNIWDVMLVEMNLYNGFKQSYSLLAMAKRYFKVVDVQEVDLFNTLDNLSSKDDWEESFWDGLEQFIIDKSTRLQFINIEDKPFTLSQILYGADDIVIPLKIRKRQLEGRVVNGEIYNPIPLHHLENEVCKGLAKVELNGIPFDRNQLAEVDAVNKSLFNSRRIKLNEWVEANHPEFTEASLFGGGMCTISWTSPKQVIPLFDKLGICPEERSKSTGKISKTVGAKALVKLLDRKSKKKFDERAFNGVENEPIEGPMGLIIHYLLFKEAQQLVKTFGEDYLKYIHPITKRVHPNFFQILSTGRLSSSKPNMMQWPSTKVYRKIVSPVDTSKFVTVDYSSQEIRILAQVSGVEEMRNFFQEEHPIFKTDFHSFTATRVARMETGDNTIVVTKKSDPERRSRAKITNFSINYGAGPPNLAGQFGCSIEEAEEFMRKYMDSWPGLQEDFDKRKRYAMENGHIPLDNVLGRRWFFSAHEEMEHVGKQARAYYPDNYRHFSRDRREEFKSELYKRHPEVKELWRTYMKMKGSLERKALNYPIQSTAGSMTKWAFVKIMQRIEAEGLEDTILICNLVHDEINAETRGKHTYAEELIRTEMENAGSIFCPDVPMIAEGEISTYWSK